MEPGDVVEMVKNAGLRGRGGAGFPTGVKWSFLPKDNPNPKYLVINCDESEPGTCKDIPMLMATPHTLIEGAIIACRAVGAHHAFAYVRGEVAHVIRRMRAAVDEAYKAGYLGKNIFGSGYDLDIVIHAGAGATSAAKRRLCSILSRVAAASRGCVRHSLRSRVCTPARRWSTTLNPFVHCQRFWRTASIGTVRWVRRRAPARRSTRFRAT